MPTAFRPLIAINGCLGEGENPKAELRLAYAQAVLRAGGIPVGLPPVGGPNDVQQLLARCDGLLLGGGDDFDMQLLGLGPTHPSATLTPPAKQEWDFVLARTAIATRIPVLGICYGMQLLGLAEGAGFHQHLPDDRPGCPEHGGNTLHPVRVSHASKLAGLTGVETLDVVSRHHQALSEVSSPWKVCATDPTGIIEAIERDEHPFALGCQWHPELSPEGSPHAKIFCGLVDAAAYRANRRLSASSPAPLPTSRTHA